MHVDLQLVEQKSSHATTFRMFFVGTLAYYASVDLPTSTSTKYSYLLQYKDLLQLMIDANREECDSTSAQCLADKMPKTMTDEDVVANCIFFLFVGTESIAHTLSYVSYQLALNPDIQERLQFEIDAYFQDKPVSD